MSKFVILDQSLRDVRGHHFELACNLTRGACDLGLNVVWWVHEDFPDTSCPEGATLRRVFSVTMYDRYMPVKGNNSKVARFFGKVRRKFGVYSDRGKML